MICKTCELDKTTDDFYKNPKGKTGYHSSCKECMKNKVKGKRDSKPKTYTIPDGQGGKWSFDLNLFNLNTPQANRIYGLISVLGKQNKNVSRRNHDNIMIVASNKKIMLEIAQFLKLEHAMYELKRAEERKEKSKWGLMLYQTGMVEQFNKISNLRRDEYKLAKREAEKWM